MEERIDTVVVGGGQAGLVTSYLLSQLAVEHVVLEQADQPGEAWRNHRWDSFTFVTPNWMIQLPGAKYEGSQPDGFMPRDEIVQYFENYVERHHLPVQFNTRLAEVNLDNGRYHLTTDKGKIQADNLVMATGTFQTPKIPDFAKNIPASVKQIHSDEYRNPHSLPDGAVLVVGSAQSGCQIAEELYLSGRKVYLCVGRAGRIPRRYRGKDVTWWLYQLGWFDHTPDQLPSPTSKFAGNPHLSGTRGGHSLNLHNFARHGVILLGHLQDARDGRLYLAPDLNNSLAKVDEFEADLQKKIDTLIEKNNLQAAEEELPILKHGYQSPELLELDLQQAGITSIIWAMGYRFDFSQVKLPILDEYGCPRQQRGITEYPGLYYVGLNWLHKRKSALLLGVGEDAAHVVAGIMERKKGTLEHIM